jgi:hypothetical protein
MSVRMASVPPEIRAEYLPNTTLEHYRHANPLVSVITEQNIEWMLRKV